MNTSSQSALSSLKKTAGKLYLKVQDFVCGRHPNLRFWHFQWLAGKELYTALEQKLPHLSGALLDIGCGEKPYQNWASKASSYTGIDLVPGSQVDQVIVPGEPLPFPDTQFDSILSTQVVEHVRDLNFYLAELARVLKPGGKILLSFPFIYPSHGEPHDYRRLSRFGAQDLFASYDLFEILEVETQGKIGSTLGLLLLTWIDTQSTNHILCAAIKVILTPLWWIFCAVVNAMGCVLNQFDTTQRYYSNVIVIARKKADNSV